MGDATTKLFKRIAPLVGSSLLLLACGPGGTPAGDTRTGPPAQRTTETVVRIANQTEPEWLVRFGRVTGQTFTAGRFFIWHGSLAYHDYENQPVAHAAVKIPSVADGTGQSIRMALCGSNGRSDPTCTGTMGCRSPRLTSHLATRSSTIPSW